MGKFKANVYLIAFLMFFSFATYAQPEGPPPDDDAVPVDGGVSLLLAAGAIWGIKKIKDKN